MLRFRQDPVGQQVPASLVVLEHRLRPLALVDQQDRLVLAVPLVQQVPVLRCRPSILEDRLLQPVRLALAVLADPPDPAGLEVLVVLHSRRDLVKVLESASESQSE